MTKSEEFVGHPDRWCPKSDCDGELNVYLIRATEREALASPGTIYYDSHEEGIFATYQIRCQKCDFELVENDGYVYM